MNDIIVLAEKKDAADHIAKALEATTEHHSYYEGNGYKVTYASGHLVKLADPQAYGFSYSIENLPIIPKSFKLKAIEEDYRLKQLEVIRELFLSASEIVVATDAGREGELIFRYIYHYLDCKKPFKRIWLRSLTKQGILTAFKNIEPGEAYNSLYYSAFSRSKADWLIGINATMALTLGSGSGSALSLGRVQTPVLAIICQRYADHINFKPEKFFTPTFIFNKDEIEVTAAYSGKRIFSKEEASKIIETLQGKVECTFSEKVKKSDKPPLLFDLDQLQIYMNSKHNYTAERTLTTIQKLYEARLVTYPRSDSRYITNDVFQEIPSLMINLKEQNERYRSFIEQLPSKLPEYVLNENKVTDHHAILPTGENPNSSLSEDEKTVYDAIVIRSIVAFGNVSNKEITTYLFNDIFESKGMVITESGWRAIEGGDSKDVKSSADAGKSLPNIEKGEWVTIDSKTIAEGTTKPLPLFTDGSLIYAMKNANKHTDDEEMSKVLRSCGIGTKGTRTNILTTLFSRSYIKREKNKILPTKIGINIFIGLKDLKITSVDLTAQLELDLEKIVTEEISSQSFDQQIQEYSKELTNSVLQVAPNLDVRNFKQKCPKCQEGKLLEGKMNIKCSRAKRDSEDGCKFIIWKVMNKKALSYDNIVDLLEKGSTPLIKGFISSKGEKKFDAMLKLNDKKEVKFLFPKPEQLDVSCPKCLRPMVAFNNRYSCNSTKEECDFVVWKKISGKSITSGMVKELIINKKTKVIKGFKSKKKKPFEAALVLSTDNKVTFSFNG